MWQCRSHAEAAIPIFREPCCIIIGCPTFFIEENALLDGLPQISTNLLSFKLSGLKFAPL